MSAKTSGPITGAEWRNETKPKKKRNRQTNDNETARQTRRKRRRRVILRRGAASRTSAAVFVVRLFLLLLLLFSARLLSRRSFGRKCVCACTRRLIYGGPWRPVAGTGPGPGRLGAALLSPGVALHPTRWRRFSTRNRLRMDRFGSDPDLMVEERQQKKKCLLRKRLRRNQKRDLWTRRPLIGRRSDGSQSAACPSGWLTIRIGPQISPGPEFA